jgi:hypothetical protein
VRLQPLAALAGPLLALAGALSGYEADLIHVVGHIVSSKAVDAPMDNIR